MSRIRGLILVAVALGLAVSDAVAGDAERAEMAVPDELAAEASGGGGSAPQPSAPGVGRASEIERAWFLPAASLDERVKATRRTSLEYGVWNLDAAARAVLTGDFGGTPVERARAAMSLAPDLPAAHMEMARAIWLHGESPIGAFRNAWEAVLAIPHHLEASVWFAGSGLMMLAVACVGGGLLCIALAGALAAPHAAHDLGDLVSRAMPGFARAALLGALLLLPVALGEGLLGVCLEQLGIGAAYGTRGQRFALALAGAAVVLGAYPLARAAGSVLTAFASDPVAEAAFSTALGSALRTDLERLEAAESDPLAARALARRARRTRSLSVADAHYQALLESEPDDWVIANNAANVRLNLGHMETALELYQRAAKQKDSPVVFYNLAQAYGRAFQVENLAKTIEYAQSLDGALLAELSQLQGTDPEGFVVDLPLPSRLLWKRLGNLRNGEPIAAELRAPLAPGRLGADPRVAAGAVAGMCLLGSLVGSRMRASRWCSRCGHLLCPRCEPEYGGGHICSACRRLFYQPEDTDRALRVERINALRHREQRVEKLVSAMSLLVPGIAGFLARKPGRSLVASLLFCLAGVAAVWRYGVVPDPLVAGGTAPFLFLHVVGLAAFGYIVVVATAFAARRSL